MVRHFGCMIACMLTLSVHSQPVGGLGKITDSGFTPIVFPGFMGGPNIKGMVSFDIDGDGKKDAAVLNGIGLDVVTVLRNESTPAVPFFNDAHGTSMATGNGADGSYPGATQIIDPDENKIAWNDVYARWEISFDVAGFSGFFLASSGGTSSYPALFHRGKTYRPTTGEIAKMLLSFAMDVKIKTD